MANVITGLFGFVGVLAGVLLSSWWRHKAWLRSERLSAYSEFLDAASQVRFRLAIPSKSPKELRAWADKYESAVLRFHAVAGRIRLLATDPVADAAAELHDELRSLLPSGQDLGAAPRPMPNLEEAHRLSSAFIRAARTEVNSWRS